MVGLRPRGRGGRSKLDSKLKNHSRWRGGGKPQGDKERGLLGWRSVVKGRRLKVGRVTGRVAISTVCCAVSRLRRWRLEGERIGEAGRQLGGKFS